MRMALVGCKAEDGFGFVGEEGVADGWRGTAAEIVAGVGHGEMLAAGGVGEDPGH